MLKGLSRSIALSAAAVISSHNLGPYNLTFLQGGIGITRPLPADLGSLRGNAAWSVTGWINPAPLSPTSQSRSQSPPMLSSPTSQLHGDVIVSSLGTSSAADSSRRRVIAIHDGKLELRANGAVLAAPRAVAAGTWQFVAGIYDGSTLKLYIDGQWVASHSASAAAAPIDPLIALAPTGDSHFGGSVAQWEYRETALDAAAVEQLYKAKPDFSVLVFQNVGVGWPWQEHAWRGLLVPQDPWTLPRSNTPPSTPVATPVSASPALQAVGDNTWILGSWKLREAPAVVGDGAQVSTLGFDDSGWYAAVVPGTVLTTLIARGVYPDPTYGLNNLAIPESLARQDYWYRTRFRNPKDPTTAKQLTLTFNGINYRAEVWLNGSRLGDIEGAFSRGVFAVGDHLRPDADNVLAVRISPPPHPGIPHEESIAAGPGENGGNLALDGPTFIASEGWDWIPGIRDRDTGLWQDVQLHATGAVQLHDPHVVTHLRLPRTDQADVAIDVGVTNTQPTPAAAVIEARFEGVTVRKSVTLAPGSSVVRLAGDEFAQLRLQHPRLWWPNGYGSPELYHLNLSVNVDGRSSDSQALTFGVRELTYELSLFDHQGRLRRVEVDPTAGSLRGERLVDVRHEAIKKTPNGWAESLTPAGETSAAVRDIPTQSLSPYLAIRVNGVPIAVRGGSWGTDDMLKRVSRERLEPYFRLHQAANLNIIRNWLGQNTEEVFYQLADEYGLLVLNDFWASTQDFQVEPEDPQLFLANARETLLRFRNHPSIAVWFGRNEGVPQPVINEGLADLIANLDGTRHYTGSSNTVNLQGSGPYNYRSPEQYFTSLAQGFSVEVGTPSLSTLESLQASIPPADRWPISDTLSYHDWHFGGNGDVASFMSTLERQYGAPQSLEDFERKAQMMNYVSYRAVFEGFQAHLWTQNSGRLLWMTHPSWPSNTWQIYSSDYDTQASYYGVKIACEPIHAQMNLPDYGLAVVNTTRQDQRGLALTSRVLSLDGRVLARASQHVNARANSTTTLSPVPSLLRLLQQEGLVLVVLTLDDGKGVRLSQNVYWQGRDDAAYRQLNALAPQALTLHAAHVADKFVQVSLQNRGTAPALAAKLTAVDATGNRVLPVQYSDNYITVLPGETRKVQISCPAVGGCQRIQLRGWNVKSTEVTVTP